MGDSEDFPENALSETAWADDFRQKDPLSRSCRSPSCRASVVVRVATGGRSAAVPLHYLREPAEHELTRAADAQQPVSWPGTFSDASMPVRWRHTVDFSGVRSQWPDDQTQLTLRRDRLRVPTAHRHGWPRRSSLAWQASEVCAEGGLEPPRSCDGQPLKLRDIGAAGRRSATERALENVPGRISAGSAVSGIRQRADTERTREHPC